MRSAVADDEKLEHLKAKALGNVMTLLVLDDDKDQQAGARLLSKILMMKFPVCSVYGDEGDAASNAAATADLILLTQMLEHLQLLNVKFASFVDLLPRRVLIDAVKKIT